MLTAAEQLQAALNSSGMRLKEWYRHVYLNSDHWRQLRRAAIEKHGAHCARCAASGHPLDVHHLRYRSIFDVVPDDLQILCRSCHDRAHGKTPSPIRRPKKRRKKNPDGLNRKKRVAARKIRKAAKRAAKKESHRRRMAEWRARNP